MAENKDLIAQIAAVWLMVRVTPDTAAESQLERIRSRLTPQEKKIFIAILDLSKQHKQLSADPLLAEKVYAAMATRTYRVQVTRNGKVNVISWGLAKGVQDSYNGVDDLPKWMQRKIAVLMIFDPKKVNEEVKNVGRRISKGTFWLYPEEGEDDGDDARAPSQDEGA